MTTLHLTKLKGSSSLSTILGLALGVLIWWLIDHLFVRNISFASLDPSIIQVILLAVIAWLVLFQLALIIASKLFTKFLLHVQNTFNPYRKLSSWQQHVLYLAFLALLVLSGTGCLIAIC